LLLGALDPRTIATASFFASYPEGSLQFQIRVTLNTVPLSCVITTGGDNASQLVVTFNSIDFQVPAVNNMKIEIIDRDPLASSVARMLNTPAIQQKMAGAIKSQLNNHLTAIGNEVTKLIRAMLDQQLGR
jgi:hypothetical protein